MSMFREYDIRGVVDQDLTDETIEKIGKAIGTTMNGTLLVGNDNLTHREHVKTIFIKWLISTGCDVIDTKINFPEGWGLIGDSNTLLTPTLKFEALNEARLNEIKNLIETEVKYVKCNACA